MSKQYGFKTTSTRKSSPDYNQTSIHIIQHPTLMMRMQRGNNLRICGPRYKQQIDTHNSVNQI